MIHYYASQKFPMYTSLPPRGRRALSCGSSLSPSLYDIQHTLLLTTHQQRLLALSITKLHITAFSASPWAVHVKFTRSAVARTEHVADYFIGGQAQCACNRIFAYVPDKSSTAHQLLVDGLTSLWDASVVRGTDGATEWESTRLHTVLVLPGVVGAWNISPPLSLPAPDCPPTRWPSEQHVAPCAHPNTPPERIATHGSASASSFSSRPCSSCVSSTSPISHECPQPSHHRTPVNDSIPTSPYTSPDRASRLSRKAKFCRA